MRRAYNRTGRFCRNLLQSACIAALLAAPCGASAQDELAGRPALSLAEQPAERSASCRELRAMTQTLPEVDYRIDLSMVGALATVRTDGALWYLTMCGAPDVRVVCVTYESNDMKPGDTVYLKGGYRRLSPDLAVLDPCLANRPEQDGAAGPGNDPTPETGPKP